ncbi:tetratricopeptide repeat protein [Psychroserpens algicola]|uniref:Tetratricopeptide repeat protein n=1 Tax=Psychroserpens algicola TaxID=1719034 RepID=A0ABT0HBU4_9FLAO|nr:tetratricopeptide repeat protein [Psychroserpens algicola]MCK8481828.1 tetratricopeptide repeat protein [Psychroserpens algicola]
MKQISLIIFALISSFSSISQEDDISKKIKDISREACTCINEIDFDLSKKEKSEKIKTCITTANMMYQMNQMMTSGLKKVNDTLSKIEDISKIDSISVDTDNQNIIIMDENYERIEEYLYENCPQMKQIYFTDNEASENSYSDRKKAMKFYEKGQLAFAKQEYTSAIVLFNKAVKKDKNFAFAWDNLGYSYRKVNNFDEAIRCYETSLAIDPKGKMPLMNIAVAYSLKNDLTNALQAYENYKSIYDDDPEGYYGMGRILYFQKDYEPALENMIKAYYLYVEMDSPYNIDAQKHIGFIYSEMKELDQLEAFNRIAKKHKLQVNIED